MENRPLEREQEENRKRLKQSRTLSDACTEERCGQGSQVASMGGLSGDSFGVREQLGKMQLLSVHLHCGESSL